MRFVLTEMYAFHLTTVPLIAATVMLFSESAAQQVIIPKRHSNSSQGYNSGKTVLTRRGNASGVQLVDVHNDDTIESGNENSEGNPNDFHRSHLRQSDRTVRVPLDSTIEESERTSILVTSNAIKVFNRMDEIGETNVNVTVNAGDITKQDGIVVGHTAYNGSVYTTMPIVHGGVENPIDNSVVYVESNIFDNIANIGASILNGAIDVGNIIVDKNVELGNTIYNSANAFLHEIGSFFRSLSEL